MAGMNGNGAIMGHTLLANGQLMGNGGPTGPVQPNGRVRLP